MQEYKICENCGKEFIPKNEKSTCCCKKCSQEKITERYRAKRIQKIVENVVDGIDEYKNSSEEMIEKAKNFLFGK